MFVNVAINLNTSYAPDYKLEPFRYNVSVLVSNVIMNLSPDVLKNIVGEAVFAQMFSYRDQLKKFRPRIRIEAFINARHR